MKLENMWKKYIWFKNKEVKTDFLLLISLWHITVGTLANTVWFDHFYDNNAFVRNWFSFFFLFCFFEHLIFSYEQIINFFLLFIKLIIVLMTDKWHILHMTISYILN